MRISDWSSDVCSSDLFPDAVVALELDLDDVAGHALGDDLEDLRQRHDLAALEQFARLDVVALVRQHGGHRKRRRDDEGRQQQERADAGGAGLDVHGGQHARPLRSEEHTSELQSLMRISYAVFCLTIKKNIE